MEDVAQEWARPDDMNNVQYRLNAKYSPAAHS